MKKKVLLTGASGGMGQECLKQMVSDLDLYDLTVFCLDNEKDRETISPYVIEYGIRVVYGDLLDYEAVQLAIAEQDLVIHIAAFVSPAADYYPRRAMEINYGSIRNILKCIKELNQEQTTKVVGIGTVAETGDRMPPIHWGRVGDPIKPSMFDYYAVSKVAAERLLIESEIKHWVSLRQTGIMGAHMARTDDAIMFHNCLNNVLEYVSDRDSGRLIKNLCQYEFTGKLPTGFWNHIYNIGGGESCRASALEMYKSIYAKMGIKNLGTIIKPKMYATRNFHGQYYLDSDKLNEYLDFRRDSMEYFYDAFLENMGSQAKASRVLCKLTLGEKLLGHLTNKKFRPLATSEHGTVHFIEDNVEDHIDAFWGSKKKWDEIPDKIEDFQEFVDWETVVHIHHGYDESKPENQLDLEDIKGAAEFRGGICLSKQMRTGNWKEKLEFQCAFGHKFNASPRLVLEGGHWCPDCERESWNYSERAKVDPFFAQVWNPLHDKNETRSYKKIITELDV